MKLLPLIILLPQLIFSQLVIQAELDPRNLIYGSEVNDPALDYTLAVGFKEYDFEIAAVYENFSEIQYKSLGVRGGKVLNPEGILNYLFLLELGIIHREVSWLDVQYHTKLGVSSELDINILRKKYGRQKSDLLALTFRLEGALRGDLDRIVGSGYIGIKSKL